LKLMSLLAISNLAGEIDGTPTLANEGPVPDLHSGYVAVKAENAQPAGIEQEMLPGGGRQPDPPRSEHAQDVTVRKQRDVAFGCARRAMTRSTGAPTCSGASPPGHPSRNISQPGALS